MRWKIPAAKHATKPAELHFASDARIKARHGHPTAAHVAIPDFKALHAANARALAARRPAVVPTVPVPPVLLTAMRAAARERFDAGRRACEAEAAALREVQEGWTWAGCKGRKGECSIAQMRCRRSIRILRSWRAMQRRGSQTPVHAALAGRHKARASFRCYRTTVMSFQTSLNCL